MPVGTVSRVPPALYTQHTRGDTQFTSSIPWRKHMGKQIEHCTYANGTRIRCGLIKCKPPLAHCLHAAPIEEMQVSMPGPQYTNTTHRP